MFALLVTLVLLAACGRAAADAHPRGRARGGGRVAALTRAEALLLVVLVVLPRAWRTRRTAAALGACLVVLTPWLVRSWTAFDEPC